MAYVALYRKYRSQSFGEVIGQHHVTAVLQNAIRMGRIAHAYLFCGPRGCGKTSTARLLARALNCQGPDGKASEPSPDPCGVCDLCRQIRDGSAMDVIEMDAASETGIDDVREKIIENAKYAPGEARYKVYIIDEVHDLSLKAFDSLLKTIEEPPQHVVFILATTEVHKVPITIRSRCQRMDFRRGTLQDLVDLLRHVLDEENIGYEIEAVAAVARSAEGSFRDSLSLLEQALAFADGDCLTADAVHASIGTIGSQLLDDVTRTVASDDLWAVYRKANELVESGKDVKQTLIALQGHLRDLLVAGIACSHQALPDVSPERFAQLQEQARWFTFPQLRSMLDILADAERNLRFTNQHRLLLETALWSIVPGQLTTGGSQHGLPAGTSPIYTSAPPATANPTRNVPAPESAPHRAEPAPAQESLNGPVQAPGDPKMSEDTAPASEDMREAASPAGQFAAQLDLDMLRRVWPRVKKRIIQASKSMLGLLTDDVQVIRLDRHVVYIGFPNEFVLGKADRPKGREFMEQVFHEELGLKGLKVRCVLLNAISEPAAAPSAQPVALSFPSEPAPAPADNPTANGHKTAQPSVALSLDAPSYQPPERAGDVNPPDPARPAEPEREEEDQQFLNLVLEEFDGRLVDEG